MKTYDLTYIISPETGSEEAEATSKEIESFVQSNEGVIVKQEKPAAKPLAYPIKGHASGFVGSIEFQLEPEKLPELQTKMQKDGKIVRHLITVKEPVRIKKMRRQKLASASTESVAAEEKKEAPEPKEAKKEEKQKVELKDIEQSLDEILGQ